jgi:hypothetical protein
MMMEFEIFIVDLPLGLSSIHFLSGFLTNSLLTFIVSTVCAECADHLALK